MKSNSYSRRQWFKTSLGLAAAAGFAQTLRADEIKYANQIHPLTGRWMMEEAAGPVTIKARLNSNENPYGPSDKAKMAIIDGFKEANRYSRSTALALKAKIAGLEGVKPEQVFLCAGLSEVLNLMGDLTGLQQGNMVSAHPTFDLMPALAAATGGKWIQVPLNARYEHDLAAMENAITPQTKLVYICNPGNPCPTIVDPQALAAFCDRVGKRTLVFIDEAYNDYIPNPIKHSMIAKIKEGQQVMVGKTLSKVHGFAGLRIAYIIGSTSIIKDLEKYRTWDFSMNAPSMIGAMATLDDNDFKQFVVKKTIEVRDNTSAALRAMGYDPLPSFTNFLIFPIKMDGSGLVKQMQEKGVALRSWSFDNKQWCRVSVGTEEEMKIFLGAMKEV